MNDLIHLIGYIFKYDILMVERSFYFCYEVGHINYGLTQINYEIDKKT